MKRVVIFFTLVLIIAVFIVQITPVCLSSSFSDGLKKTGETGAGYPGGANYTSLGFLAKLAGNTLTPVFMGVMGLLLFFYGGYTWMMAKGNEQQTEKARAIIVNTAIAMVIALSAYAIVTLILPLWTFVTQK
jgi:hypothetical protein